ncbi:ribokinase [bacterium]|nr:ribokinase [bacterium]
MNHVPMRDPDLPPIDYLLIGHLTADLMLDGSRRLGGTTAYAAATAAAFRLRVGVVTSAAPDDPLLEQLRQWARVHLIPAAATTTFENLYEPDGRRQFVRALAAPLTPESVPTVWRHTPAVHLAPIAGEVSDALPGCCNNHVLLTLQGWLRQWESDGLVRFRRWCDAAVLRHINVVVLSEEDIRAAPDLEQDLAHSCETLLLTQAERGGTCYERASAWRYAAFPVHVIEPTGAGDVFAAALLAAHIHAGQGLRQAVMVAARLAANAVTRPGLQGTPTPDEVAAALEG